MSNIHASSSSSSSIFQAYHHAPANARPGVDASFTPISKSATPVPDALASASASSPVSGTPTAGGENGLAQNQNGESGYTAAIAALCARISKRSRMKRRTAEEEDAAVQTALRVAANLAADHLAVLYPDVDTPFADAVDAVKRLLPYHVFQHPEEDFANVSSKGKRKATEEDLLREEIAETKFALDCWRRRKALEERFRKARINSGRRTAPDDQTYVLAQAVVESERAESASTSSELRSARVELDRIERERKATATPTTPAARHPQMYYNTQTPTPTATSAYSSNYRGYTYPYSPMYGSSQYTYDPARAYAAAGAQYPTTPVTTTTYQIQTPSSYQSATPTTTAYTQSTATSPVTPSSATLARLPAATTTPAAPMPPMKAIPVQLPAASLPALIALGIQPVAAASIAPDQPQPAAVLKGTSQNGAMLSLEINVASLQSAQMSGLALILNALTSRGVNVDGAPSASTISGAAAATSLAANAGSSLGASGATPPSGVGGNAGTDK